MNLKVIGSDCVGCDFENLETWSIRMMNNDMIHMSVGMLTLRVSSQGHGDDNYSFGMRKNHYLGYYCETGHSQVEMSPLFL